MKRRTILVGLGSVSVGAGTLVGSGAYSAARIRRETSIAVVPDSDALLGLGPCTDEDGNPLQNSVYVVEDSGQFALQISEDNEAIDGDGVNVNSIYWFDQVFQICNQADHPVCIDLQVDVPEISGPVPEKYDFEAGDDAVVFYREDDRDDIIDVAEFQPRSEWFPLASGECVCIGFVVRSFGFDVGTDILEDAELSVQAFSVDECDPEAPPEDGDEEEEEDEDEEDEEEPEPRSQGFWRNNRDEWPVEEIEVGGEDYSRDTAIEKMEQPTEGDQTRSLFRQLVAAKLNVEDGIVSSCISETIDDADEWLEENELGSGVSGDSDAWEAGEPLKDKLEDFNENGCPV